MVPDLGISIINHSNPQMLRDCIASIYSSTKSIQFEIWVIDNATDQKQVPEIRAEFPDVKWMFNKSRLGFSANHNQALAVAPGRYLCILNDDTIIHDGALDELVRHMDENPKAGMTGPRLLNRDGSIQNSTFRAKTLLGETIDMLQLPGGLNRLKLRGIDPAQFSDHVGKVDWLLGACLVIRRETLDQVGLLDDVLSPIANCEEVDWCDRVRRSGWTIDFVPTSRITHFGGQSLKSDSVGADRFRIEMQRVVLAYFYKQHGVLFGMLLRGVFVLTLPWNGLMLAQSVLRGRTDKPEAVAVWKTLLGIAAIAMKPLPKPYCRRDRPVSTRGNTRGPAVSAHSVGHAGI